MARAIKPIKDIHVGDKDWTAKVILIEKGTPRDAKSSPTKFQMFVFADAEIVPNPTQWIISYQTRIEEVVSAECLPDVEHSFVPFSRLHEYMDRQIDVDIIAMVIEMSPKKQICTRTGLSTIQELSLISEEYNINKTKVDNLLGSENQCGSSAFPIVCNTYDIISISDVSNVIEKRRSFWIRAKMNITKLDQNFWYMSCSKCGKAMPYEYEEIFVCHSCNQDACKGEPRCRITVDLMDETSTMLVVIFGSDAEQIFGVTAMNLMNETMQDVEKIVALCPTEPLTMHIRATSYEYNNCINWRYMVLSIDRPPQEAVPLLTYGVENLEKETSSDGKEKAHSTKRSLLLEFETSSDDSDAETLSSIKRTAQISSSISAKASLHLKKKMKKEVDKKE
ncbi:hypothetical protein FNV43_RR21491 [Rhamnella rubrinervis]|uniref:Replication factor A C-terminal domain-containing protein n=1 Tax=Rhamnella rubrinervis TaxID=2594499 RepID=A0A8K0E8I7_9ROSA|nr:hypothetical protein FNV43_RR21491 [Rhamnella rubrinervis]